MKTYIFIEIDDEDGIQIPIIVKAENRKDAENQILSIYYDRYEDEEEDKEEFIRGGFDNLSDLIDQFIVFTSEKELVYYQISDPDFLQVWTKFLLQ